jgi:uncharacterized protein YijF (DUF1287 family)
VPIERGVCTDVVVRAFRAIGIDLQVRVYEDMKRNFSVYPKDWGATAPTADTIPGTNRHYIIHNMGSGTHKEDALRYFTILGQYRW